MRISFPLSKVTVVRMRNFEKFGFARKISPCGKLALEFPKKVGRGVKIGECVGCDNPQWLKIFILSGKSQTRCCQMSTAHLSMER